MLLSLPIPPTHTLNNSRRAKSPEVRLFQTEIEIVGTLEGCVVSGSGDGPEFKLALHHLTPCTGFSTAPGLFPHLFVVSTKKNGCSVLLLPGPSFSLGVTKVEVTYSYLVLFPLQRTCPQALACTGSWEQTVKISRIWLANS